ncbi:hypothetical protein PRIPAC_77983 [Pristionchus pacificus]|uniref:Uncharacterized protein n=1 Tax=Pristionchus pacificus TaxID=54126 RepID=A0A2A6CMH8_PRIPA|nr:hypothetical protein PRIPAC_77983 [Pristionchus pacificus]|eukprot:PDM79402.1 hypothetical protein PRIPAC_31981 [Pristionchus pacificus]
MCDYYDKNPLYAIRLPNVFSSFEATIAVIGSSVILLAVLLIRSLRLPSNDSSKPFLLMLSLGMALATAASIALFFYRSCYLGREFGIYASMIDKVGRFASANSLLFGGGLILLGASKSAHTDEKVAACSIWFFQSAIALISVMVGMLCHYFWSELGFFPAFVFYVPPVFGFIFLMIGRVVECCRTKKDTSSDKTTGQTPLCSLFYFLAAPVVLIVATRNQRGIETLDGYDVLQRVLTHKIRGFHDDSRRGDWAGMFDALQAMPVIKGVDIEQWELFLPIVVVLSALIFHPSLRCCRTSEKSEIAPSSDEVDKLHASQKLVPGWSMTAPFPTISAAHTNNMMMAPQMTANTTTMPQMPMSTTHARVSFPMMACNNNNNQVPAAAPNPSQMNPIIMSPSYPMHFLVPASHQHPQQVHGMGGRPTTLCTLGSNVFMQIILLYYVKKMPCAGAAKPFFLVLSLGMLVGTIGSTAICVAKATNLTEQIGYHARTVEEFGRFASLATLLFGGGFYLIGEANASNKTSGSVCYLSWFIQLAVVVLAVLVTLGNFSLLLDGWISYIYMMLPTIGFFFIVIALLIGIARACNSKESDDEPCSKSRRLAQLFLFFATPVAMTVVTRGVDGAEMLVRFIGRGSYGNKFDPSDPYGIWQILTTTEGWIRGIWQVELFFPTAIVLSALIFHPSIRGLCCRSTEKSKIAPIDTPDVAHQPMMMMHPMMSTPQMMMIPQAMHPVNTPISVPQHSMMAPQIHTPPQMMMIPQNMNTNPPLMSTQPLSPPQPTFAPHPTNLYEHPVMHGMGGRPVYMMA